METKDTPASDQMAALDEAAGKAGSITALAERIGTSQSTISMWRARGRVPAEYCPAIERATEIPCERLRPDVPWDVLRLRAAPPPWDGVDRRADGRQEDTAT